MQGESDMKEKSLLFSKHIKAILYSLYLNKLLGAVVKINLTHKSNIEWGNLISD
jgi:hypothetical protein